VRKVLHLCGGLICALAALGSIAFAQETVICCGFTSVGGVIAGGGLTLVDAMGQSSPIGLSTCTQVHLCAGLLCCLSEGEIIGPVVPPEEMVLLGPNPLTSEGGIFWLDLPSDATSASLLILDVDGALLVRIPLALPIDRYPKVGRWTPYDDLGRRLGTGLYLYLVEIMHGDGSVTFSPVEKMVVIH